MRITSSVEYATRLMVGLAREHGNAPLSAERLSESEHVPSDYVAQLLVKLRRAGLIESLRGSQGGYRLSRKPAEITLGQVVRAIEGEVFEDVCAKYETGSKDCRHQSHCSISPVWKRLGAMVTGYFDGLTLAAILDEKGACSASWVDKLAAPR